MKTLSFQTTGRIVPDGSVESLYCVETPTSEFTTYDLNEAVAEMQALLLTGLFNEITFFDRTHEVVSLFNDMVFLGWSLTETIAYYIGEEAFDVVSA